MVQPPLNFHRALCALLALLLLGGTAAGALGVVNLHQQGVRHAQSIRDLERQIADLGNRLDSTEALVAQARQPETLRARVPAGLVPAQPAQLVWVRPPPPARVPVETLPDFSLQLAALESTPVPGRPR